MTPKLATRIEGLFVGSVAEHWPGKPLSAIQKHAVTESQEVTWTGLKSDQQADSAVHGGSEKAIHHYAFEHYSLWQSEGQMNQNTPAAAFGENISTMGMNEDNLCIGDILRLGSATVQVSQGRQPCWKLAAYTGNDKMPFLFQRTGRTGWYYRVLEEGTIAAGERMFLIERPQPTWTIRRVTQARLTKRIPPTEAAILAEMIELAPGWRLAFERIATGNIKEDTSARLGM